MSGDIDNHPDPMARINSEEEARNWLLALVEDVKRIRAQCDTPVLAMRVKDLQRLHKAFLVKHGAALGTLTALYRCGMLSGIAYNELRQTVLDTMLPTVIQLDAFPKETR